MNPLKLTGRRPRTGAALLLLWLGLLSATGLRADVPPEAVEQGLQAAGANQFTLDESGKNPVLRYTVNGQKYAYEISDSGVKAL